MLRGEDDHNATAFDEELKSGAESGVNFSESVINQEIHPQTLESTGDNQSQITGSKQSNLATSVEVLGSMPTHDIRSINEKQILENRQTESQLGNYKPPSDDKSTQTSHNQHKKSESNALKAETENGQY